MKFIKRLPLDSNNVQSDRFAVLADDRITTNTKVALELPSGLSQERPGAYTNGQIRYNTSLHEFEVYNGTTPGTGWERVRTVRPAPITVQQIGVGDYAITQFGPLRYTTGEPYTNYQKPENIFVYVENVFQIPNENYVLTNVGTTATSVVVEFTSPPPNKKVWAIMGYDGYFPSV